MSTSWISVYEEGRPDEAGDDQADGPDRALHGTTELRGGPGGRADAREDHDRGGPRVGRCSEIHAPLREKCKKPFELTMTISEREKAKVKCPTCKGTKIVPQLGGFMTQTSKKS